MRTALLAMAGAALAVVATAGSPSASAQTNAPEPPVQGQEWSPTASELVRETVTDKSGHAVGEVRAVTEDALIVSLDRPLGLGERLVRLPRDQVWVDQVGNVTRIEAQMSRARIERLPDYEGPPEAP